MNRKDDFLNKTNRLESIRFKWIGESIRIGMHYWPPGKLEGCRHAPTRLSALLDPPQLTLPTTSHERVILNTLRQCVIDWSGTHCSVLAYNAQRRRLCMFTGVISAEAWLRHYRKFVCSFFVQCLYCWLYLDTVWLKLCSVLLTGKTDVN